MWRKLVLVVSALATGNLLNGCTSECNARTDSGFFETAGGVLSGCYEREDNKLMQQIQAQQNLNNNLKAMLASLEQEKQAVASQRAGQQSRMAALNSAWNSLKNDLDAKAQTNQALQKQIDEMQAGMDSINNTPSLTEAQKVKRLDTLRSQVQLLTDQLANEPYY